MTMKRKIIALAAILALAFAAGQNLFAQTDDQTDPQDLEDQITAVDQTGQGDLTALLTRLSIQYNVELTVLQDLSAQGYEPGQIWLALEITAASTTTLQDALVLVDETEGHGWGVLAQKLGIAPGSAEFFALKEKLEEHNGAMISEMNQNREKNDQGKGKPEADNDGKTGEDNRAGHGEGNGEGKR